MRRRRERDQAREIELLRASVDSGREYANWQAQQRSQRVVPLVDVPGGLAYDPEFAEFLQWRRQWRQEQAQNAA